MRRRNIGFENGKARRARVRRVVLPFYARGGEAERVWKKG